MAAYTAYFIDQNRHVARALLEAVSDEEAGREAAALVDSGTVELWAGPRRVGSFNGRGPVKPLAPPLPEKRDAWLTEAIALHRAGKFAEAAELYAALLKAEPENSKVLGLLGTLNYRRGEFQEALRSLELSLKLDPQQPFTLTISGNTLCRLGRYREAVAAYQKAIALKADHAAAHSNLGNALVALNRPIEALASCEKAIAIRPNDSESHSCRGNALRALRRHAEALASCDKAIELNPNNAVAYLNRARTYAALHRLAEAADDYDKSIALDPSNAETHKHGGDLCRARRAYQEALALYDNAITLRPDYAAAHYARGNALGKLKRYGEALDSIDTARALDVSLPYAWGNRLSIKARICDWDGFPEESRDLVAAIGRGELVSTPFTFLSLPSTPGAQRRCAELYANDRYPAPSLPDRNATKSAGLMPHDRIRVAYVSSTYYTHAGSTLLVGILEQHDRSKFEIYGISMSPNEESDFRNRIEKSLDHFIDVSEKSDVEVATMLRDLEIDIAVDLRGYTNSSRPGIFVHRAAPVQVNFLGFAGTTGAASMDYIIADRIVIPPEEQSSYSEQVVYLPDTYQSNDSNRLIGEAVQTRAEAGLPAQGFVFCCFNDTYKLRPEMFDAWMRLLHDVEGSVLWLLKPDAIAIDNLRRESEKRRIDPDRLVFAERMKPPEHLARHRLADLFLDALPFGAHTTASDALWAGLPVLTCAGNTFAGRVAASLLQAIGLPDLVTHSLAEYENLALKLARDPAALADVRSRLERNRATYPLFDTVRFTRHLEAAYTRMMETHRSGLPPAAFAVEAAARAQ